MGVSVPASRSNSWTFQGNSNGNYLVISTWADGKLEPTNVKMVMVGNLPNFTLGRPAWAMNRIRFRPAGVTYCYLTSTVWRGAANGLPQQFCNVWCSCVLTVCSVLNTVQSSKVMLAAKQKVTCTVHWKLWARLWHRGDQMHWACV
jgi:hypothetical protein